jgi:hypothetical protein
MEKTKTDDIIEAATPVLLALVGLIITAMALFVPNVENNVRMFALGGGSTSVGGGLGAYSKKKKNT